ncbi:hypothetical protein FBU59_000511 [Linderina macrospora]|uniref:Uncharacterized protein n=1 Tax=Linderina macrospora TaxID=4868 RepID=A0ACC1JGG1_9FUNG|nr:hypothetical protein FBU59_000511 [Linderina macrospora]
MSQLSFSSDDSERVSVMSTLISTSEHTMAKTEYSCEVVVEDLDPEDISFALALGDRASERIECVRINRCRMDGATFSALVDEMCKVDLSRLQTFDIAQNSVGGELVGPALLRLILHAKNIRHLALGWNKIALADLAALAPAKDSDIQLSIGHLDLRANPLSQPLKSSSRRSAKIATGAYSLTDLSWLPSLVAAMPRLTHVLLAQASVGDGDLVALIHALVAAVPPIEYIGLEWLGLGSRLSALRAILGDLSPKLAASPLRLHLNLSANTLGDSGMKVISESPAKMTSLTLSCNFVTERGASYLAQWLPCSGVSDLDLSDNHFGDQGVAALLSVPLPARNDTDAGWVIGGVRYSTQIKSLGLTSCCLSDTSLRMLTDAIGGQWAPLSSLRILRNSRISHGTKIAI